MVTTTKDKLKNNLTDSDVDLIAQQGASTLGEAQIIALLRKIEENTRKV